LQIKASLFYDWSDVFSQQLFYKCFELINDIFKVLGASLIAGDLFEDFISELKHVKDLFFYPHVLFIQTDKIFNSCI